MFGVTRTGSTLSLPIPATWPGLDRCPDAATTEACGQGMSWPHKANQEPIIPAWGTPVLLPHMADEMSIRVRVRVVQRSRWQRRRLWCRRWSHRSPDPDIDSKPDIVGEVPAWVIWIRAVVDDDLVAVPQPAIAKLVVGKRHGEVEAAEPEGLGPPPPRVQRCLGPNPPLNRLAPE